MTALRFDAAESARFEAAYTTPDAVRRRGLAVATLGVRAGDRVVDVGCGPGFAVAELAAAVGPGGTVVGVDASADMLARAAHRCAGLPGVTLLDGDATALPLEPASADAALSVQVLEYVEDVDAALRELGRVLRPGGRVVVWDTDWATLSWHSEDPVRMARVLAAWDEHLVHRTLPRTLGPALRAAGFRDVAMTAHAFASAGDARDSFGPKVAMPAITAYVPGHGGVDEAEAAAWAQEQRERLDAGTFYFTLTQCCFTGIREG